MKRIPVSWPGETDATPSAVPIQIHCSELLIHSILQRGFRDSRSVSEVQKLTMLQLRQWEKSPAEILRCL